MFFAIHEGRPNRQKAVESAWLGSKGANIIVFFLCLGNVSKWLRTFFFVLFAHAVDKVVVFSQSSDLQLDLFIGKYPVVLLERINIPGEKDDDDSYDKNKDAPVFLPGKSIKSL